MLCNNCCNAGNCVEGRNNCGHHRFFLFRLALGIIILVIVFSVGVKMGELKGMFDNDYRDGYMMRGYGVYGRPMMQQPMMYYNNQASPTAVPR